MNLPAIRVGVIIHPLAAMLTRETAVTLQWTNKVFLSGCYG